MSTRLRGHSVYLFVSLVLTSITLLGCGGGGAPAPPPCDPLYQLCGPFPPAYFPAITSLSPASATVGTNGLGLTINGSHFTSSSSVLWNGSTLSTAFVNSGTLQAQVPAADLQVTGMATVSVTDPTEGSSGSLAFVINPATLQVTVVNVVANDLAWDPVYQKIYLSLQNSNTLQVVDPQTGTLESSTYTGDTPDQLAVSATSQYLYVGLDGTASVQRLTLPNLETDISIPLGSDPSNIPYSATELLVARIPITPCPWSAAMRPRHRPRQLLGRC